MENLKIISEIDKTKWSNFVFNHPKGNIFQTPEMFEVYKNTKNCEPVFLAAVNNNEISGILVAVIQKESTGFLGRFTARAVISGGPLIADINGREEILKLFLDTLEEKLKKGVIYVQFRNLYDLSSWREYFTSKGYVSEEHLDFISDLTLGEKKLWEKLFSARRNKIRGAQKEGIKVKAADNISQIEEGYSILKKTYSRVKLPLAGKDMFMSAYDILSDKNMASCLMATLENKLIGILFLLRYRDCAYVWYAGSLPEYYTKHPNDILYWEAIEWSRRNNYKIFCFGGAGNPNEKYGVREFKKQFGGDLVNYGRFIKTYKPFCMKMINIAMKLRKFI